MAMGVTGVSGRAFPAHAGMNRCSPRCPRARCSVPRVCGDEPETGDTFKRAQARSPRMRG